MPPHPLVNFEIQKYYLKELKFNGVYSGNNLCKIKYVAYVINLDVYKSIETHWIALYVNGNKRRTSYDAVYFGNFRVERIRKEIKQKYHQIFIGYKHYDSIMCRYFWIGFIYFLLKGNSLIDYTDLFSSNDYNKVILKYFQ